ncbi:hypothetical protein CEXT_62731 [Caerostris extrusa]|uniref:Uncharacterized protein n=1 Tax=Caerostris extrusa TaxID=172846 RepID=A0AAV4QXP8_CAEEX|nr:hypothetical protein CEXT_62731 [Caerostris extrusa]
MTYAELLNVLRKRKWISRKATSPSSTPTSHQHPLMMASLCLKKVNKFQARCSLDNSLIIPEGPIPIQAARAEKKRPGPSAIKNKITFISLFTFHLLLLLREEASISH